MVTLHKGSVPGQPQPTLACKEHKAEEDGGLSTQMLLAFWWFSKQGISEESQFGLTCMSLP